MNVVITGANGGLGSALLSACARLHPSWRATGVIRKDADLARPLDVVHPILSANPDVVIHCAAMTRVDACETEPELARAVNVEGTRAVASAAETAGARMVYISTDYVFDGKGGAPYPVGAAPNPLNVYGKTKLEGEFLTLAEKNSLVVRTSWLYGKVGKSFPAAVLRLCQTQKEIRMVTDQKSSPTYSEDLAAAIIKLLGKKASGIYHVSNSGSATWHEFAKAVMELKGIRGVKLTATTSDELKAAAKRPADSRLDCSLYSALAGAPLRDWREALAEHLR
ncbi:MAG: dTDP-4-dehydrorhamnose reductase [Nitrospinae bacterium]|nr:dTDP-4-dehydrorhamnose reductase [Nitrospinota bacterium]